MRHTGESYKIRISGAGVPEELIEHTSRPGPVPEPSSTAFVCCVEDSAELQGILARTAALELEVLEVRALPAALPGALPTAASKE